MPLTIALGTLIGILLFPNFSIWEACILAVILAPTDAALGQAVVSNPRVPIRIRQALNVESGLNDGIAVPVILVFISLASAVGGGEGLMYWVGFTSKQLILGPVIGITFGYIGGKLIQWGTRTAWMDDNFQRLSGVALAILCFAVAEVVGGNGFISAFVAGLVFGNTSRAICHCVHEFMEAEGQLLALFTFLLFGLVMVPSAMNLITLSTIVYAILSLSVVRIIPVIISQTKMTLQADTLLFLGWFGPRGIASVIFGLIVIEQHQIPHAEDIFIIAVVTILFSVFAHGITAVPASNAYAQKAESMKDEADSMPELLEIEMM
jgi:sodium/hydrogen antiporter